MRTIITTLGLVLAACLALAAGQQPPKGTRLDAIAWLAAEKLLTADAVVVIPLGAAAKEHGPHLTLGNDFRMAEYLARRVEQASAVVIAPTVPYHYYPAFLEYPGSTSLSPDTARTLIADIVRSLSRYGPRRFYVLNTGISTRQPLQAAVRELARDGILLGFTDLAATLEPVARRIQQQEGGTHADEIETSMMLYIDPGAVKMDLAVKDYTPVAPRPGQGLTRSRERAGTYSPTGTWGDPTLATREKGRIVTDALVTSILDDIERIRGAALPVAQPQAAAPAELPATAPPAGSRAAGDGRRCTPQDERAIRQIGDAFTLHWTNQDAERFAALWSDDGDVVHPDEMIETGRRTIQANRTALFMRREYRGSRHPLTVRAIRCLTSSIAVADGKWELRGVSDANGKPLPTFEGQATLVLQRADGWNIEAYRYTIKPAAVPPPQLWFKRPGLPDKQ